ncbi:MAG: putative ligase [Acidimicrobiales bacterium]|nr:MAG: fatty acyl-AMP ligase [Actinomycetota bacterium]MBV6507584.1 putative ligase [Acidimicrobiales bacterium]RIK07520.1 MAG: fatty-acid--CoA ligase [Acidobacteriota bacterium]
MLTLISRIEKAAGSPGRIVFPSADDYDSLSWAQLHDEAKIMAAGLQARGVEPGDHVGVLGPTSRRLVTAIQAIWLAGATVVTLPLPMRLGSIEQFVESTRVRVRRADVSHLVIDPELVAFMDAEPGDPPFILLPDLLPDVGRLKVTDYERPLDDPEALAVLQFTSGSTSEPRGVMLPHATICHNLDGASEASRLNDDDVIVSWLPLYHDMGFIGCMLLPMTTGIGLVQAAPQDFLAKPLRWMEWISEFRGTATAGPNFSYVLATRALKRAANLDLSSMRVLLNGAEPIDADAYRKFLREASRFGLDPRSAFPAFGMAEVCIAGTFPKPMEGFRTDVVDGEVLEHEHYAAPTSSESDNARELAILGRPVPGLQIRIVDPHTGQVRREREVGELQIRGTSVTSGYYKRPEATAELFSNGWLKTGDLAYVVDGEMVMCGRIKDVIIIGGRNVYPQDVERAAGGVEGIRAGNVIAFGLEGRNRKQHIVVVAETKANDADELVHVVTHEVTRAVGIPPKEVILVAPGTIPKTSSGKLQRTLCKQQFLDKELQLV